MSYLYYFFTEVILFTPTSLPGCSSSGRGGERISAAADTLTISLPIAQTDSITLIYADNKTLTTCLSEDESRELDHLLRTASYDPAWNQSGIMVKMVAPDYTVIFHYREKPQEEEDWLMIWKENERAKFRNKWYLISSGNRETISRMLEDQSN